MLINQKENNKKYIIKGLAIVFMYFFISIFQTLPFEILNIDITTVPKMLLMFYNIALEVIMILIIFLTYKEEIKLAAKDMKKNYFNYFKKYFKYYILGVIVMIASNLIINFYGGGLSENESSIREAFEKFPLYTYVSAVFLAPVLEELVFRLGIRSIFKNKVLFILISSLIFGSLHILTNPIDKLLPLYLLSYSSVAVAFAYMMIKTNNVFVSMGLHFLHNGFIMSLQFLLLILT